MPKPLSLVTISRVLWRQVIFNAQIVWRLDFVVLVQATSRTFEVSMPSATLVRTPVIQRALQHLRWSNIHPMKSPALCRTSTTLAVTLPSATLVRTPVIQRALQHLRWSKIHPMKSTALCRTSMTAVTLPSAIQVRKLMIQKALKLLHWSKIHTVKPQVWFVLLT
jgi:hypothetical protein